MERRAAAVGSAAMLAVEAIGSVSMWSAIPLAWLWIGGRVYALTGSLGADLGVAFFGFAATTVLALSELNRLDGAWVGLRRRAGHEQEVGVLSQVVTASTTLGLVTFLVWYYFLTDAFVIPFMPTQ
jgi:hypothetical protein